MSRSQGSNPPPATTPESGNGSQRSTPLPPIDEVCRILARVLVRVQANGQSDAPEVS